MEGAERWRLGEADVAANPHGGNPAGFRECPRSDDVEAPKQKGPAYREMQDFQRLS